MIGQSELDELLAQRERINEVVREIIDEGTDPWGIEVTGVEIKDIDLPQEMKRAMARQAEAERERRGKVIAAEGEYQASMKLVAAAEIMERYPVALQLRFLQTVVEIAAENNSTTIFPIPIELFRPLIERGVGEADRESTVRALKFAAEKMVEALPEGGDRAAIEAAARRMIGMSSAVREPTEKVVVTPSDEADGDDDREV